jgi:hypothetical protein
MLVVSADVEASMANGAEHTLLLIPQGVPADSAPIPEPSSVAVFSMIMIGYLVNKRLRPHPAPDRA